jgi:hypothetical protein
LNVHRINDVRQIEIHAAESLVPELSPFEVEIAIAKLRSCKSPGINQIPAELFQAGGETKCSEIHKLFFFLIRKNCLRSGRSLLLYQFTRMAIKLTVVIIEAYHCYQLHTKFFQISFSQGLSPYIDKITGDNPCES